MDNKEFIEQKIDNARDLIETISKQRDPKNIEPHTGEAPKVDFSESKPGQSDSILVTTFKQVRLYRTYPERRASVKDTANNFLIRTENGVTIYQPIIYTEPIYGK